MGKTKFIVVDTKTGEVTEGEREVVPSAAPPLELITVDLRDLKKLIDKAKKDKII